MPNGNGRKKLQELQGIAGNWYSAAYGAGVQQFANLQSAYRGMLRNQSAMGWTQARQTGRDLRQSVGWDVMFGRRR